MAPCPALGATNPHRARKRTEWIHISRGTTRRSPVEGARPAVFGWVRFAPSVALAPPPGEAKPQNDKSRHGKKDNIEVDTNAAGVEIREEVDPER